MFQFQKHWQTLHSMWTVKLGGTKPQTCCMLMGRGHTAPMSCVLWADQTTIWHTSYQHIKLCWVSSQLPLGLLRCGPEKPRKPCRTVSSLLTGICSWGSTKRTLRVLPTVLETMCSFVRKMLFPQKGSGASQTTSPGLTRTLRSS